MKIADGRLGLWFGLCPGPASPTSGHDVVCVDKDASKIERLHAGIMPIDAPGLATGVVRANVRGGRLSFSTDLATSMRVGAQATTSSPWARLRARGDRHADLSLCLRRGAGNRRQSDAPAVIVTKSTVPVGTGDEVERIIRDSGTGVQFAVVSNTEFLREGAAISDFKRPDRIVVGAEDEWERGVMREVYRPLFLNKAPLLFTGRRRFRADRNMRRMRSLRPRSRSSTKWRTCARRLAPMFRMWRAGLDLITESVQNSSTPGPGYGGSCFPKDTLALLKTAEDFASPVRIVEAVVLVNESRKRAMGRKVIEALAEAGVGEPRAAQDRAAGPDVQAQYRRYARCALDCDRAGAD